MKKNEGEIEKLDSIKASDLQEVFRKLYSQKEVFAFGTYHIVQNQRRIARFITRILGFPILPDDNTFSLNIKRSETKELWLRRFSDSSINSVLTFQDEEITEQFKGFTFKFKILLTPTGQIKYNFTQMKLWNFPVPRIFCFSPHAIMIPKTENQWYFSISVYGPFQIFLFRYEGTAHMTDLFLQ